MPVVSFPLTVRELVADDPAVCAPSGLPVATGGVDYPESPGAGTLYQLHVHELVRSAGIGTVLIAAAERCIRARGLARAELGVDAQAPRPRPLYERLGYRARRRQPGGWVTEGPDGSTSHYETTIIVMTKSLVAA